MLVCVLNWEAENLHVSKESTPRLTMSLSESKQLSMASVIGQVLYWFEKHPPVTLRHDQIISNAVVVR